MASERIATLCILTACLFGLTTLLQDQLFLLPLGLFKTGFFLGTLVMIITEWVKEPIIAKRNKVSHVLVFFWTFFLLFTSKFMHELLFSEQEYMTNHDQIMDVNSGLYFFAILIGLGWQILISFHEKSFLRWLQLANACVLSACLMFQLVDWLIVPATMWILIVLSSRGMRSFDRGVALLFYFIISSAWISGYFFGADAVYYSL